MTLEPYVAPALTRTDIVRYQGASGDMNPIHYDDAFAQAAGYPGAFSVGMLHAGTLATYLAERLGEENVRRFSARFVAQVWPGDVLTYAGWIVREYERGGVTHVDVEADVTSSRGETHVRAEATFVVHTFA